VVGTGAERDGQGWVAVKQDKRLGTGEIAQRDPGKIADPNVDGHAHAEDGPAQDDAFAVKFHLPDASIRTDVMRIEAEGKRWGVGPPGAARPGGIDPAYCCLTPHGFGLPARIMFPVDA
jgi:hypothetical protein